MDSMSKARSSFPPMSERSGPISPPWPRARWQRAQRQALGVSKEHAAAAGIAMVRGRKPDVFRRTSLAANRRVGARNRGRGNPQSDQRNDEPAKASIHGESSETAFPARSRYLRIYQRFITDTSQMTRSPRKNECPADSTRRPHPFEPSLGDPECAIRSAPSVQGQRSVANPGAGTSFLQRTTDI